MGVVAGLCSMLAATQTANAAPMDFALSRLGIAPNNSTCMGEARQWCKDQSLFERLMLQFGTSMMLPGGSPAATLGVQGFYLGVDTTFTTIDSDQGQWLRGTQGDTRSEGTGINGDVDSTLIWNRVMARKGLPFGFELDASLAQAASTEIWMLGVGLKWAFIEGFRTGLGRLPDMALRASLAATAGARDASLTVVGMDLLLSKPIVIDRAWTVTPTLALQGAWLFADSDLVDLTPGDDAFEECRPRAGHQLPDAQGTGGRTIGCLGDSRDYENTVVFGSFRRFNLRLLAGAEVRYRRFLTRASLSYDVVAPTIDETDDPLPAMSRQLSINLGLGVAF